MGARSIDEASSIASGDVVSAKVFLEGRLARRASGRAGGEVVNVVAVFEGGRGVQAGSSIGHISLVADQSLAEGDLERVAVGIDGAGNGDYFF